MTGNEPIIEGLRERLNQLQAKHRQEPDRASDEFWKGLANHHDPAGTGLGGVGPDATAVPVRAVPEPPAPAESADPARPLVDPTN